MLVLDNGAGNIKLGAQGYSGINVYENCIVRKKDNRAIYLGHQLPQSGTLQYRRPHERGYLTNWESQKAIWDGIFQRNKINTSEVGVIVTEAPFNLDSLQTSCDEMIFEEYEFQSYLRCQPSALASWCRLDGSSKTEESRCYEACLVVDSGFSFTHITPVIRGIPQVVNIRKVPIGGKLLTNLLKETISFRHYNMMEETNLVNQIKEQCCFVTTDVDRDLELAQNKTLVKEYALPDFSANKSGFLVTKDTIVDDEQQVLSLRNELFMTPEILFNPSDIGMKHGGIVQAIFEALEGLSEELTSLCLSNIILIGGNTKFVGFKQRLQQDLRSVTDSKYDIRVFAPQDPITFACQGGLALIEQAETLRGMVVTREEYLESGRRAILQKFGSSFRDSAFETQGGQRSKYVETEEEENDRSIDSDSDTTN